MTIKNVITVGNCVHYLLDTSGINLKMVSYDQGCRYSALGASKGVKSLQGTNKEPSFYMVTEMKSTLFHPDDMPIVDLMQSYPGFTSNFNVHSCFFFSFVLTSPLFFMHLKTLKQ
ncbi:hypothetical protein CRE_07067 [Caenorhabditis remanei]|uniref:Uncharacterized protein n=1 Tax=Caenorhabditis remanei TaxID=31234 RepID=E3NJG4_CAERE|nr:hypothetical protein CRE_07067 [Caenorhabditis remanei]